MEFNKVTHVIFDLDGLIIESESGYDQIISEIARQYGKEYTLESRMKILGTPENETARLAVLLMQLPISPEEFHAQAAEKVKTVLCNPPLLEGAEKLLRHLYKHKIPFAMATSGSKEATEIKMTNYPELMDMFLHKVMSSSDAEVKRGKPNPDIYLVCASRFADKPKPEMCLVFEDAPNGVVGAVAAGMQVVMVPSNETSQELCKPATLVLNSLNEFKPELFGLPPYE